ncbi:hypothetical protein [Cellulomonas aerilata]|uniref:hypothetical protein n=1 Tax=Cellulomonas aerilata TaxID=515326 RepID=UPI001FE2F0D9|nr:hypothetical protein [Cellulomonas aerilata]
MADDVRFGSALPPVRAVDLSDLAPEVAGPLVALLAAVDGLGSLDEVDVDGRAADAVAAVIGQARSRLAVRQARMVAVIEADGLWSTQARSLSTWVARRYDVSARTAQVTVRLGRALRDHLPLTTCR